MEQMMYIALALACFLLSEAAALRYVMMPRAAKTAKSNAMVWSGSTAMFFCAFVLIAQV